MTKNFKMVAKTLFGMEELLEKANLCGRTAIRILKLITAFNIVTEEDLYKKIYEMPWEHYKDVKRTLDVNATVFSEVFTHSQYSDVDAIDAVVGRFRHRDGV